MTKYAFAALAFAVGVAVIGDAQAFLPELPDSAPTPKPVSPKPPKPTPPKPKPRPESPPKPKPGPSQKHPGGDKPNSQPNARSHPSAHWCEDIGGKRNGKVCEMPYTPEECAQKGGKLRAERCHLPEPDCASSGASENEEGTCIELVKKGQHPVQPEPEPDCAGDEEANEEGECVPIQTSEQDCKENQGTWDSLRDSCVPKE